ncbi:hypothetical protein NL676_007825 [Syzygium grande]|nr:hypothetical protein NL676_007825 [Syzygium grande]
MRNTERRDKKEDLSSSSGVCFHDHDRELHDQTLFLAALGPSHGCSSAYRCHLTKLAVVHEEVAAAVPTFDDDDNEEPLRPLALDVPTACAKPTS